MRSLRQLRRSPRAQIGLLAALIGVLFLFLKYPPIDPTEEEAVWARPKMTEGLLGGRLRPPEGFRIGLYATDLPRVRMLRFTAFGDLLASIPQLGQVVLLLRDRDRDGKADGRRVLLSGLSHPHGIDLHGGALYVAEGGAVTRVGLDEQAGVVKGERQQVVRGVPDGGGHWTRSLRIGPDQKIYVSVGSTCNVCIEKDRRRAAIVRYDLSGQNETLFATGLRNSVGLAFQPGTGHLYATDNGRDLLGDDFPPCELNRIEEGQFYGWPFANGDRIPDPDYGKGRQKEIAASRPPVFGFRAHNAPLGLTFSEGAKLPPRYQGAAFVALHGSWNRSVPDGYKVVALHFTPAGVRQEDFLTGFLKDDNIIGRPVDVAVGPDGALYVSDDSAGVVYRVEWTGK